MIRVPVRWLAGWFIIYYLCSSHCSSLPYAYPPPEARRDKRPRLCQSEHRTSFLVLATLIRKYQHDYDAIVCPGPLLHSLVSKSQRTKRAQFGMRSLHAIQHNLYFIFLLFPSHRISHKFRRSSLHSSASPSFGRRHRSLCSTYTET